MRQASQQSDQFSHLISRRAGQLPRDIATAEATAKWPDEEAIGDGDLPAGPLWDPPLVEDDDEPLPDERDFWIEADHDGDR